MGVGPHGVRSFMIFQKNKLYKIRFFDHAISLDSPMVCECVGFCVEDEKDYVVLSSWICITDDVEVFENNLEKTVLLKSCIIKSRKH